MQIYSKSQNHHHLVFVLLPQESRLALKLRMDGPNLQIECSYFTAFGESLVLSENILSRVRNWLNQQIQKSSTTPVDPSLFNQWPLMNTHQLAEYLKNHDGRFDVSFKDHVLTNLY